MGPVGAADATRGAEVGAGAPGAVGMVGIGGGAEAMSIGAGMGAGAGADLGIDD